MSAMLTPRRTDVACAILLVGGIVYSLLCLPAIGRRGYPPIDPIWLGVTHLWIQRLNHKIIGWGISRGFDD